MIQLAAWTYGSLIAVVIVFQVCLMAGAPWGKLTQGGRVQGALPVKGRLVAGFLFCYWRAWLGASCLQRQCRRTGRNG